MLKIYGSMMCPDCVECRKDLDSAGISYEYLDFADDLRNLKAFLALRDQDPVFAAVREEGKIGIPCIVDGENVLLQWDSYVSQDEA